LKPTPLSLPSAAIALALLLAGSSVPLCAADSATPLSAANAALQAGEADKALDLLASLRPADANTAEAHNIACRVRLTLEQWDTAIAECERAVGLDAANSNDHLWFARALGQKAGHASFLSAYSLAKRAHAEFEQAVQLNPRNADALADLGEFYRQAPGVIGGGLDKASNLCNQLEKLDPPRAHVLRGRIAEDQKDLVAAEHEFKLALAANPHPALQWTSLASFYARHKRIPEMESAIHSVNAAVARDRHSSVALFDGASLLVESNRDPALAAKMLDEYLASPFKSEDAPAFVAHLRLAKLKAQLGDPAAAERERAAALALAHDYKPALTTDPQPSRSQESKN
jgi:tetratricopeptide (TPR) repeat protein